MRQRALTPAKASLELKVWTPNPKRKRWKFPRQYTNDGRADTAALCRLVPLFVFGDARFDDLFDQRVGKRLVCRKLDGSLGGAIPLEFFREPIEKSGASGEETAMICECGIGNQHAVVLEHWHPVADDFGGLRRHDRPNDLADML